MAKRQASSGEAVLPEVFFDAVAHFLPGLNEVAQQCGISIGEVAQPPWKEDLAQHVLSHLRRGDWQPLLARERGSEVPNHSLKHLKIRRVEWTIAQASNIIVE